MLARMIVVPPLQELRLRRSAKWSTYPSDVLPLWVAEMDVELAEPVREALACAVRRSDTGYVGPAGDVAEALAGFAARRWSWEVDPGDVRLVPDVAVGVVEVLRRVVAPGDAVAFSPPVYPPFFGWVEEVRGRRREVPLTAQGRLDLAALDEAFAGDVRAYVLCNPHNPLGRVHAHEELAQLARLAQRHGVTVLSDEIHAPLALPGARWTPYLTVSDEAREHGVALVSASKAWNLAGLKCACVVTAGSRMRESVRLPEEVHWRTGLLGAVATAAAFRAGEEWLDALLGLLDANRALVGRLVADHLPAARHSPPEAGYLAWLDLRGLGWGDDPAGHVLEGARVALSPGPDFGTQGRGFARLNFGTSAEILEEAMHRVGTLAAPAA